MKVKIRETIYNSKDEPIMVIFDKKEKENIISLGLTSYCAYSENMDKEKAMEFTNIDNVHYFPTESKWILVENALPEKNGRYGILYQYKGSKRIQFFIADYLSVEEKWVSTPSNTKIVAWMEFPAIPANLFI